MSNNDQLAGPYLVGIALAALSGSIVTALVFVVFGL